MDELAALVSQALAEDVGGGDLTTCATVAADAEGNALITQKAPGIIFGLDVAERTFSLLDARARFERLVSEGRWRDAGGPVLRIHAPARALLPGGRKALKFLAHLSGGETLSAPADQAVEGTREEGAGTH